MITWRKGKKCLIFDNKYDIFLEVDLYRRCDVENIPDDIACFGQFSVNC